MDPKKRAYVETYGCQMNISDGELMQGILVAGGYDIAASAEDADVVLVNTCAIREHAEQRVLGRVSQLAALKRDRPGLVIGVTGCMAQRMGADLLERAPYVDLVMGPDGYRGLPEALSGIDARRASLEGPRSAKSRVQLAVLDLNLGESYEGLEQRRASDVSAWITIQRGCDHRCSFCIVPYVRGPEKNRRGEDVLAEVRAVAARGISEVTLLGQTVNSYRHEGWTFPALLRAVARVAGIRRVRFTSPHPADVNEALVEVMATEGAVCEHLHLPLQSGSDRVLKRMVRRYGVAEYMEKVAMVRAAVPDVALSTDLIAGFPGESEADFEATVDVVRAVRFDEAYTYRYSPREGTPATRMPSDWTVPDDVAQARLERLIALTRALQAEVSRAELGRVEEILVDRPGREPGQMIGRTRRNKVVAFDGDPHWVGGYRTVRLERTSGATFGGRVVEEPVRAESA
ncbi:MAG: tRNA (N6-isopentenyl adenosine(37)-C2)-methylthiotransferase MiaB [Gemmatimonadetes bacterium]|nr:tRNA (N6-isopentenyl adenosine(37)-C2)-methylthiotransferase MiaB [Gemmatimonadota bacterium]